MGAQLSFVLVNEATQSPLLAQLSADWWAKLAQALTVQYDRDIAPEWGGSATYRVGDAGSIVADEIVLATLDALTTPGAIAYHDQDGKGVPVGYLGLNTCQTLDDVSTAWSHEGAETGGDPACNLWADDGNGTEWANELSDAVESNRYTIDGIAVSDFVRRSFFNPNAAGPYSYCNAPTKPFQTTRGGYQLQRKVGSNIVQVTASAESKRGALVAAGLHLEGSRPHRRGAALAGFQGLLKGR